MNRKTLFISVAGLLLLVFVVVTIIFQNNKGILPGVVGSNSQSVVERLGAPIKGPVGAKVTIVEFFDPACGTCADFYPLVKKLIDQYPGKVRVMLRYAPLHTGSDQVVKMLQAAHLQGRFFPALELLFKNQQRWVVNHVSQPKQARGLLNGLAMDHKKFNFDMNQPDLTEVIQQDVEDAQALKVQATPEFFVNGQALTSFGYEQLSQLVEKAVADAY